MNFPRREIVDAVKKEYPKGTRVALVSMDDPYRDIPEGTLGTVKSVDDTGTIHVAWDGYGELGIVYGEDSCRKIRICPKCGKAYNEPPALSRADNKTQICSECGTLEALEAAGASPETKDEILDAIKSV